jgi:hypothetical protein
MDTNQIIQWLTSETNRNSDYHNHKETMAWLATALYLTGIITAGLSLNQLHGIVWKIIATIIFGIVTLITIWFINWQFKNRDIARLKVKYLIKTALKLLEPAYPELWQKDFDDHWLLPNYILNKIPESDRKQMKDVGGGTEAPKAISRTAIAIAGVIFLVSVWSCLF